MSIPSIQDIEEKLGIHYSDITLDAVQLQNNKVSLNVLRLDKIHPIISGNKYFKLKYNLLDCYQKKKKGILTFGGAFSNHLHATAYACFKLNLPMVAVIRGEEPAELSPTLKALKAWNAQLVFVPREVYKDKDDPYYIEQLKQEFGDYFIIPEGGSNYNGINGSMEIMDLIPKDTTHIICASGTATTLAGVCIKNDANKKIISFTALKASDFLKTELYPKLKYTLFDDELSDTLYDSCTEIGDYHFGGYAKTKPELLQFIQEFEQAHHIPLDKVYTGKMMFGLLDLIQKGYFPESAKIVAIHSGGLQGN